MSTTIWIDYILKYKTSIYSTPPLMLLCRGNPQFIHAKHMKIPCQSAAPLRVYNFISSSNDPHVPVLWQLRVPLIPEIPS